MAINFPAGDSLNSPFNAPNGVTYIWNTDGYWEAQTNSSGGSGGDGTPGGINTEVQYNSGGAFAGDNGLTYTEATETLTIASSVAISAGLLDIKNLGSVSELKLYCEVGNLHFTALKSAPHASYTGGSVTLTLPSVSPPNIGDVLGADDLTGTLTWITPASPPPGYTDADVDTHLNTGSATDGQILSYTSGDYLWIDEPEGFSGDYNDLTNKPSIPPAYGDADVDAHLNQSSAQANTVLEWSGTDYNWVSPNSVGGQYGDSDVEALFGAYNFHLIPGTNATYDIGTAEKKVRHLFLSDNSLRFVDGSNIEYPLSVDAPNLMFNGQQVAMVSDIGSVTTGDTPPDSAANGDLWYSSSAARLFIYYTDSSGDSYWVDAAPTGASETPDLQEVTDNGNTTTNGATFGDGNIELNADGSADFAGNVNVGIGNTSGQATAFRAYATSAYPAEFRSTGAASYIIFNNTEITNSFENSLGFIGNSFALNIDNRRRFRIIPRRDSEEVDANLSQAWVDFGASISNTQDPTTRFALGVQAQKDSGVPDGESISGSCMIHQGDIRIGSGGDISALAASPNITLNADGSAYFGGNISQNIIPFAGGGTWDLKESNVWTLTNDSMPNPLNADAGQTGVIYNDVEVTSYGNYFKLPGGNVTPIPAKSVTPYFVQDTNVILLGNSSKQYT